MGKVKVTTTFGRVVEILPEEVDILKKVGMLNQAWEHPDKEKQLKKKEYLNKLPVLTTEEKKARIKEAKRLRRKGYSVREIARRLGVSHTAAQKWFNK